MMRARLVRVLLIAIAAMGPLHGPAIGAGAAPTPLRATSLSGLLAGEGLFAVRARLAFSPDNAFLCLPDRFGRAVMAVDIYGKALWRLDLPPGREVDDLAIDRSGRLVLRPSGVDEIWIYEQPTLPPTVAKLPTGIPAGREVEVRRSLGGIFLRAKDEEVCFRLGADGAVIGVDTLAAGKATIWAYAQDGSLWFYKAGDRKIRGGRDGKDSIRLDAPLAPKSHLAVGPDGNVWAYDPSSGLIVGYTTNGFLRAAYAIDPSVPDPAGFWIDGAGAFWIGDSRSGRFFRYVP
jgi:hypothetical protein